jgi:hypothetical protein
MDFYAWERRLTNMIDLCCRLRVDFARRASMDVDLVGARRANLGLIVLWCNRRVA